MRNERWQFKRENFERSARNLLYGTPVFRPLRSCYQGLLDRPKMARRREMQEFYAPFMRRDDLVFDIGANVGNYSELFSELGARVVSVEPNPRCCERLRRLTRGHRIYLEECAVGDARGRAYLQVCEQSTISTMAESWCEKSRESKFHRDAKWSGKLEVEVKTLDQLRDRYGVPSFIKVDVEGYDDHVLRGMSFLPKALSFEFIRWVPDVAKRCLELPILQGRYRFNYVSGMEMRLVSESWMSIEALQKRLASITDEEEYGDVFASRID